MAHYAFLDENNIVTEIITGRDENDLPEGVSDWEEWYGNFRGQACKRTSYNTYRDYRYYFDDSDPPQIIEEYFGVKHREGGVPFRGQYAQIGDIYDAEKDEFITPDFYFDSSINK